MVLPYAPEALEPVISKETIAFHHGKHLAGYVNNLNTLLEGSPLADLTLEKIVLKAEVLPEQVGIAVPAEAWGTDVLVLTDEQKAQLKALVEKLIEG